MKSGEKEEDCCDEINDYVGKTVSLI